jgi:hypothetical protein
LRLHGCAKARGLGTEGLLLLLAILLLAVLRLLLAVLRLAGVAGAVAAP